MKRTLTLLTAVIFTGAMALPAFAQVGAGVAGNANVGDSGMHAGANSDVANSDAERAEPASPADSSPARLRRHARRSENPTENSTKNSTTITTAAHQPRGIDANGAVGATAGAVVRPPDGRADAGSANNPSGGDQGVQ